jgi:glyoxylase-like metal-dependent hydrolase (beta-lactamase superfamily II)
MRTFVLSAAIGAAIVCTTAAQESAVGVLHVQGNVYMLATAAGNIAVQIGEEGVLLVDTSTAASAPEVLAAVRKVSDKTIRWIVNTGVDPDHTGGNAAIAKAGSATPQNQFGSGRNFPGVLAAPATIVAHEAVLTRMVAQGKDKQPQAGWPTMTYFGEGRDMFFNDEAIQIVHEPQAHADGDSIVYFRRSDVLCAGEIFNTTSFPVIDVKAGGTINGVIAGLNHILDITIPKDKQEGGTFVIPGHGRLTDEADVAQYRTMVTIIRDRIRDMKAHGMALEQVKAAKPTSGFDRRWSTPTWTADMFVEAVYVTLAPSPATAQR